MRSSLAIPKTCFDVYGKVEFLEAYKNKLTEFSIHF